MAETVNVSSSPGPNYSWSSGTFTWGSATAGKNWSTAYIAAKITKPLTNAVQDAVDRSKAKRNEGTSIDDLRRKNGLSKVEHIIYELRDSLGESDPSFQSVANSFADEVIACAINAINSHKAVPTALVLAEWAAC